MKSIHIVPGFNDPACGIAVAAKMLIAHDVGEKDEVWVHSMWTPMVIKASVMALFAGKKLVRMPHGNLDPLRVKFHGWKKWLVGPIERWCLRRASKVIATCEAEAKWIRAYEPRVRLIEVIDLKHYFRLRPEKYAEREGGRPLHLLYLGRQHPLKGIDYLKAAVRQIEESCPHSASSHLSVKIVSDAFGEEKEDVWAWCDVLVLPTLSENFGLVIAEALERGKRVITTDGAPAWGDGNDYGGLLIYLRGFMEASDDERIVMLKQAIESLETK